MTYSATMPRRALLNTAPLTLSLAVALASGSLAAHAQAAPAPVNLAPAPSLEGVLGAAQLDRAGAMALYRQAVLAGRVPALDAALDQAAAQAPVQRRTIALLVKAITQWQRGDLAGAQAAAKAALALAHDGAAGADAALLQAQLADASGEPATARALYGRINTADGAPLPAVLCAGTVAGQVDPAALATWATAEGTPGRATRAAPVLALLGDPRDALSLAGAVAQGAPTMADHLRRADWALAAGDSATAVAQAQAAVSQAHDSEDRRYALAVMIEGWRQRGDLAGALAMLDAVPQSADVTQARVDLLLELGRFDAAIALVSASSDPAVRQRLLGILDLAGRTGDRIAEYRRLVAANPDRLEGYAALAALYLAQQQRDQAVTTYRDYFARNPARADLLVPAAQQMLAADLRDEAMALMQAAVARSPALDVPWRFFQVAALRGEGDDAAALQQLAQLDRVLPAGDPRRVTLADTFEAMGHKDAALAVLRKLEANGGARDYDQAVHIAMLAMATGNAADAVARWRALWVQAALPARKAYLAKQLIRAARDAGTLDRLTADLQAGLAKGAGKAGLDQIGLLVELRIATNDRAAALADLDRFAHAGGLDEVARQKQLVTINTRLADGEGANAALRRLVVIDRANSDLYLRQLAVNAARFAPPGESEAARQARIDQVLAQLRSAAGLDNADAWRFAAAVHLAANDIVRARADWERAWAAAPADIDTLVQYGDLLKRQGEGARAAAMLQLTALGATREADFSTAIAALVGVLSPDPMGDAPSAQDKAAADRTLAWAERAVLARLVQDGTDLPLLSLLADVAQARGDRALQQRAYIASLPEAGTQRATLLRMLVSLASGGAAGDAAGMPGAGNVQAKLAFGRRLIALRREFPPEVYTDLARAMLSVGDRPGAERAFALLNDGSGLVDVDRVKGDAYAAQGMVAPALLNYDRALLRDRDDLDLVVRVGILREQHGDGTIAYAEYWRALQVLVRQVPEQGADNDEGAGLDIKQVYPALVEGLLLNWPADATASAAGMAQVRALLDRAMAGIAPGGADRLADHGRLALVADLARRLAARLDDRGLAQDVARGLAERFPADRQVPLLAARLDGNMGWQTPLPETTADWPRQALGRQAQAQSNDELAQVLVLADGSDAAITAQVKAALASEAAARQAAADGPAPGAPSALFSLVLKALDRLPPDRMRALVLNSIEAAPFRDAFLFDVYRSGVGRFARLEAIAGHPLLDKPTLLKLMVARGSLPLPMARETQYARGDDDASPAALIMPFSIDDKLALYDALVARMEQSGSETAFQSALVTALLKESLAPAQLDRLMQTLSRDMLYVRRGGDKVAALVIERLVVPDVAPGNRSRLLQLAQAVAARYADARNLPGFLAATFAGNRDEAYRLLMNLQADTARHFPGRDYATPIARRLFAAQRQAAIDAFLADPAPTPQAAAQFFDRFVAGLDATGTPAEQAALPRYLEKLVAADPDNKRWLIRLLALRRGTPDQPGFIGPLADYVARHGDDHDAASLLQAALRLAGRDADAAALARRAGVSLRDPAWLREIVGRGADGADTPGEGGGFAGLFGAVYTLAYKVRFAADPAVMAAQTARAPAMQPPGGVTAPAAPLVPALAQGTPALRAVARAAWRRTAPADDGNGAPGQPRAQFVAALSDAAPALLAGLAQPALTAELEQWLMALPPDDRRRQERLYALLATGLERQGVAPERIADGVAALLAGSISPHELDVLTVLADRATAPLAASATAALAKRLAVQDMLSPAQRVRFARLLARSGQWDVAGGLFQGAVLQLIYPAPGEDAEFDESRALLAAIRGNLAQWSDAAAAARAAEGIDGVLRRELGKRLHVPPFDAWTGKGQQ